MKDVSVIIREIRKANNLTQEQFAKKFFITAKTVSNYEKGLRKPSLEFLEKICKEFNLTIDSLTNLPDSPSKPSDLVVSRLNGKCAIYDKGRSLYLIPHLYNDIILSPYNYHVVHNIIKIYDEGVPIPKCTNTAVVDNSGNVTEFKKFEFLLSRNPFNVFGVNQACFCGNKKTGGWYLINHKEEVISKRKYFIYNVDEKGDFGLYMALDRSPDPDLPWPEKFIPVLKLLNYEGKEIDAHFIIELRPGYKYAREGSYPFNTIVKDQENRYVNFTNMLRNEDLINIDEAVKQIKLYGPNIICLIPNEIFAINDNYRKIIDAVCEYVGNLDKSLQHEDYFLYTLELVEQMARNPYVKPFYFEKPKCNYDLSYLKYKTKKIQNKISSFYYNLGHFAYYNYSR